MHGVYCLITKCNIQIKQSFKVEPHFLSCYCWNYLFLKVINSPPPKKKEKKNFPPSWIRTPATPVLGERSNYSTILPLHIRLCSLSYLNSCLLIAVTSTKQAGVFPGKMCSDGRKNHGILHPRQVVLELPCPSPRVCTSGCIR